MVDVDVDIQHAGMVEEQLQDGEHDVVDVAETRGLGFLGVVQPAGPVDGHLRLVRGEFARGVEGGARVEGGVLVEPVEDGTVFADVEGFTAGLGVFGARVEGGCAGGGDVLAAPFEREG